MCAPSGVGLCRTSSGGSVGVAGRRLGVAVTSEGQALFWPPIAGHLPPPRCAALVVDAARDETGCFVLAHPS
jgi:hypothetical protein